MSETSRCSSAALPKRKARVSTCNPSPRRVTHRSAMRLWFRAGSSSSKSSLQTQVMIRERPGAACAQTLLPARRSGLRTQRVQIPQICSSRLTSRELQANWVSRACAVAPRNASKALSAASLVCASMMACTLSACVYESMRSYSNSKPGLYLKQVQTPCNARPPQHRT